MSCTAGAGSAARTSAKLMTFAELCERVRQEEELAVAGCAQWQLVLMALPGERSSGQKAHKVLLVSYA